MRLANEIRQKYGAPHYTFEDVTNEIRKHVIETYEEVARFKFSYWPGFDIILSNDVPKMKWDYGKEVSCIHWLKIPEGSLDFDSRKITDWFENEGLIYTANEYGLSKGWRIKF